MNLLFVCFAFAGIAAIDLPGMIKKNGGVISSSMA